MNNYDLVIVGTGFAGTVIAYKAAEAGKKVLIYERRNHIAGNMYDEYDENGILVQRYGPHTFHTSNIEVKDFLSSIYEWIPYTLKARVNINGVLTPSPFNFKTIDQFYDTNSAENLKKSLLEEFSGRDKIPVLSLLSSKSEKIRQYARFLIEEDYRPYSAKQWGIDPDKLDESVWSRVPVRLSYKDGYFDDLWEVQPKGGYTELFKKMLSNSNITIRLGEDILEHLKLVPEDGIVLFDNEKFDKKIVYTGALDELFGCKYGKLEYRSLKFEFETYNISSYQETSGVAYPKADGFTRITEYTKLPEQLGFDKTVIAREYPIKHDSNTEPYYPILTESTKSLADNYRSLAEKFCNIILCGRLAEFKYYNMDEVVFKAIEISKQLGL